MSPFAIAVTVAVVSFFSSGVALNAHTKLVVFSFDGFRFDYLTKANTPTLNGLRDNGVTTPFMIPQFTTKTFPNHQSIATGLYSEVHGIVENAVFDPELNSSLSGYADDHDFWVYNDNVVPIWLLNELAGDGRISGAQFPGSTQPYGRDERTITHLLGYDSNRPFQERMDIVIQWLTNETHPANLAFMYFEEPDSQGHAFGPDSPEVRQAIEDLDSMTAYFVQRLNDLDIFDQVNLIFLSDHGMEEVREKNTIPLEELVDPAYEYTWRGGSPLLQIWPNDESETDEMYEAFLNASTTRPFNVYTKENAPAHWFYNNRRVSPILLASDPGFVFNESWETADTKSHQRRNSGNEQRAPETAFGIHGYDSESTNMRAFFIAHGPAFLQGVSIEPFQNIDLFPLMCQLMGFDPPPHNGTLARVTPALRSSASAAHLFHATVIPGNLNNLQRCGEVSAAQMEFKFKKK